jgi:heme exporter protein D
MYFDSLGAALAMDGHGAYVWSAYAVTLLVLALLLIAPGRRRRRLLRELNGELKRRQNAPTTVGEEGV